MPAPQRRALEVALLRREPEQTGVDQLAVSLATLQVLRTLAADAPVVVGIDDLQWLDGATTRVLAFVLRRLGDERLGLVVSVRAEHADRLPLQVEQALPEPQRLVLRVGPLPVGVLDQLLRDRLGLALSRPSLQRLQQVCGGNPFYALELARVLPAGATLAPGEALQVPTTLAGLLRGRLQQVSDRAGGLLLAAAALAKPTVALLEQVGGGLDEALAAGILERDGVLVRFRHPLLGSLVYADASAPQRHQTHRLLAELVDEPEEQALHLALGTQDPDERAAGRLEDAAQRASARGAPDAAAQLAEHASRLTPVRWSPADCRRRLAASDYHARAGNGPRPRPARGADRPPAPRNDPRQGPGRAGLAGHRRQLGSAVHPGQGRGSRRSGPPSPDRTPPWDTQKALLATTPPGSGMRRPRWRWPRRPMTAHSSFKRLPSWAPSACFAAMAAA